MTGLLRLGPREDLPPWLEALDAEVFGTPWGPLGSHDRMLALPELAFARWSVVPVAGEAELIRIATAPAARRQGLGRRLLEASEADLRAAGIESIYLEVRVSNAPARALYEALGWLPQRVRKAYYHDGEDAAIYGKRL